MACCSTSPPRRCARSPPIRSTWVPGSARPWCSVLGGSALTHHPHVHGIVRRRSRARCRPLGAVQAGLLPLGPGALAAVSSALHRRTAERTPVLRRVHRTWPTPIPSPTGSCRCASASGWSTPSVRSQDREQVLAYLSRYTHRVAISNSRLVALDDRGVTFRWKDYREHRRTRYKTMTLHIEEFMRRFLLHVLPCGFHRIRHYGLLANANRKTNIATARELLQQPAPDIAAEPSAVHDSTGSVRPTFVCRHCGAPMIIIETFARAPHIRGPPCLPGSP